MNDETRVTYRKESVTVIDQDAQEGLTAVIADGISRALAWPLALVKMIMVAWGVVVLLQVTPWMRDDTDKQGWLAERSGMRPYIDNATGCEYLSSGGGLTPRLGVHGEHMGCAK